MDSKALVARLRHLISARGLTLTATAELSGFQAGNLRRMLSGDDPNPRLKSLLRVTGALHLCLAPFEGSDEGALLREVAEVFKKSGKSVQDVAQASNVSAVRVRKLLVANSASCSLKSFVALCTTLGIDLELQSRTPAAVVKLAVDEASQDDVSSDPEPIQPLGSSSTPASAPSMRSERQVNAAKSPFDRPFEYDFTARVRQARESRRLESRGAFERTCPTGGERKAASSLQESLNVIFDTGRRYHQDLNFRVRANNFIFEVQEIMDAIQAGFAGKPE